MQLCRPVEEGFLPEGPLSFPKPLGSGGVVGRLRDGARMWPLLAAVAQNPVQLVKSDIPARLGDANGGWGAGGHRAATLKPHQCHTTPSLHFVPLRLMETPRSPDNAFYNRKINRLDFWEQF